MNKNTPSTSNSGRIISVSCLTVVVLLSMLWEIVSAYLAGGSDAPSIGILIAAIVILGGGTLFAIILILRHAKHFLPGQTQDPPSE